MKVRDYEVDSEGIVNNAVYLHYLEHTRHEFCQQAGLSFRQMRERGMAPVVSHVDINYRTPLGLGETMTSLLALERVATVRVPPVDCQCRRRSGGGRQNRHCES